MVKKRSMEPTKDDWIAAYREATKEKNAYVRLLVHVANCPKCCVECNEHIVKTIEQIERTRKIQSDLTQPPALDQRS